MKTFSTHSKSQEIMKLKKCVSAIIFFTALCVGSIYVKAQETANGFFKICS